MSTRAGKALIAAGDVLAARLDETDVAEPYWPKYDERIKSNMRARQRAVRAWLAVAHPNGEGHKP